MVAVVVVRVAAKLCADTHDSLGSPLPQGLGLGLPIVHHLPQCAARVRVVCLRMRGAFRLKYFTIIDVVSRVRSIAYHLLSLEIVMLFAAHICTLCVSFRKCVSLALSASFNHLSKVKVSVTQT